MITPSITVSITDMANFVGRSKAVTERAAELLVLRGALLLQRKAAEEAPVGKQEIHPLSKRRKRTLGIRETVKILGTRQAGARSWAMVGTTREYAKWVARGTTPHVIEHRRAKVLTFKPRADDPVLRGLDEYGFAHAKQVFHPGNKPNPFMERAAAKTGKEISRLWQGAWEKAQTEIGGTHSLPRPEISRSSP